MDKKQQLKKRVLSLVRSMEDKYSRGVQYRILSQKFHRNANSANVDLMELVEELDQTRELYMYMSDSGAILLMAPELREQITEDDFGFLTESAKDVLFSRWGKHATKD